MWKYLIITRGKLGKTLTKKGILGIMPPQLRDADYSNVVEREMGEAPLWTPSEDRVKNSQILKFQKGIESKFNLSFDDYLDFHKWSCENNELFYRELLDFYEVKYEGNPDNVSGKGQAFLNYPWFPELKLNFAENLLRYKDSDQVAINSVHESGNLQKITYKELYKRVAIFQAHLKSVGVGKGDVVACYMPNIAETVIAMLATSALGGTFTSTSCDFGVQGVLDRFGQTKPKVLISVTGYSYNTKFFDLTAKIKEVTEKISSIENVVLVNFLDRADAELAELGAIKNLTRYESLTNGDEVEFTNVAFNHPQYIMYSSGTTGKPKCIVHSVGGTLLQHIKELGLHCDLTAEKNIMYFTTCGWMMWNWLVSSLYFGGTTVLYEGSPGCPSLGDFIKIIDREDIHIYGTSPKFLKALEDSLGSELGIEGKNLETVLSTGAPLLPEQFDYVYENLKKDVLLGSICGGTDIIGCFMLGNPSLPVYRGEIQGPGLAMDIAAFDENGQPVFNREGELVCLKPFISQPVGFHEDQGNKRFSSAYFEVYENTWHHGDFITLTDRKGVLVHGRSDATLNPGGVRIGTAEIYRQTEKLDYIEDSVCVGESFEGDVRVVLFVKLKEGIELDATKVKEIQTTIRKNTTPRHTPEVVKQVTGIPYTRSGKKMELAVSRIINGKKLTNIEAVSNPESLIEYENYQA